MMRRAFIAAGFALAALTGGLATPALAADAPPPVTAQDHILGRANAPVTVIEYASFTCSHCADFHNTVLPAFKAKYIDTGKVRLCLLYTSPSPRDKRQSRMPSSA